MAARQVDARTRELQARSTALVTKNYVEPKDDMAAERRRATFDVNQLMYVLNGGKDKVDRRNRFAEELARSPWGDKTQRYNLSREDEYLGGLRAALGIREKMAREKLVLDDGLALRQLVDFPGGLELHVGMFLPTILGQGTPEQQSKWLPPSMALQIIGTYAQTELGHGTFVRGLETTATYDPLTQEFVVHSPTQTSTKWWPGGMGKTATHAIVMARLITQGKDYGPHAFIVQLRDLATHLPMPGVELGDIGNKYAFGGVDNGFMRMDHVRVPRDQMMMRFSQVAPDGAYVPPPPANSKASYATMLWVRADIVKNAGHYLARATTIATRYSVVRRQTAPGAGQRELQVLDYQNVSAILLPLVGASYALHFMGETIMAKYQQFEANRERGDFEILPELHALSSGLKALCTWITADGIETCRRTCGGHGYSRLSGLPTLFTNYVQNVTWEGDNNVLCLQTARYLLKALAAAASGQKVVGSCAYLGDLRAELGARCVVSNAAGWTDVAASLAALRHRATRLATLAADVLRAANAGAGGGGGKVAFEGAAWNSVTTDMIRLSQAHCAYVLLETFAGVVDRYEAQRSLSAPGVAALRRLASMYGLSLVNAAAGDLLEDGYVTGAQAAAARAAFATLLVELRPDAVALVDAWGFPDYLLHSALGRADGDVYRALYEMAQNSPLNATQVGPAWEPLLKGVMLRKGVPKL